MIGQTISHYKILDKLGEVPRPNDRSVGRAKSPTSVSLRVVATLSLPASLNSWRQAGIPLSARLPGGQEAKAGAESYDWTNGFSLQNP